MEYLFLTLIRGYREDVAKFFEPSVEAIADAFERQREAATRLQMRVKVRSTAALCHLDGSIVLCSTPFLLVAMQPVISCTTVFSNIRYFRMCTCVDRRVTRTYHIPT